MQAHLWETVFLGKGTVFPKRKHQLSGLIIKLTLAYTNLTCYFDKLIWNLKWRRLPGRPAQLNQCHPRSRNTVQLLKLLYLHV